ncbi:S8 family serine peptidase [Streptomyces sp. NPDC004539]|uniref:S8 family serine peptidase n=1 Tax=Streptomyces sp. NPDC004539 TaxID=3154280 RepID=UPI0033B2619C
MIPHTPHAGRLTATAARVLVPLLACGLALSSTSPVRAAPADRPAAQAGTSYPAGTYLVQLAASPVATDHRTAPRPGHRLDTGTRAVRDHLGRLAHERDQVLDRVPGIKPLYTYQYVLNGFTAELSAAEATRLSRSPEVTSLTRKEIYPLASHPTRTPVAVPDTAGFLGLKGRDGLYSRVPGGQREAGAGMIVGVLDTGIDPRNPSLGALPEPRPDAAVIAGKWKGGCDPGADPAHRVTCNNKVIGAQYFRAGVDSPTDRDWASPMDADSHGTHTATTAAGNLDVPATVPGTGIAGTVSGLTPAARIAVYKVCWSEGCDSTGIVAAYDKAVADGVDVINYSVGVGRTLTGPIVTAMFNAAKAGVFVSAAAGNDGPGTVEPVAPWVTSVAASTHDVAFRTTLTLGDGTSYTGAGVGASAVAATRLVDAARAARAGADPAQAELCKPDTLDPASVAGAIVLCRRGDNARVDKSAQVKAAGGAGMVLYDATAGEARFADVHAVPGVHVDNATGLAVKAYAATAGATAGLSAAEATRQPAPRIAAFSAGGPDPVSGGDLLKPDIAAPGVDVVAGTTPGGEDGAYTGEHGLMSGTSMAAPHIAGMALLLRSLHPDWSPMAVKSALMTTATTADDDGGPIRREDGTPGTPLDFGAGQARPSRADDPGLVYDSTSADWIAYVCALGHSPVTGDGSDACATARKTDPSDLNHPTVSVGDLTGRQSVSRTVTNVARWPSVYTVAVDAPPGFDVTVSPRRLVVAPGASATYTVTFTRTDAAYGAWAFGSLTWRDGRGHQVRSVTALRAGAAQSPAAGWYWRNSSWSGARSAMTAP